MLKKGEFYEFGELVLECKKVHSQKIATFYIIKNGIRERHNGWLAIWSEKVILLSHELYRVVPTNCLQKQLF